MADDGVKTAIGVLAVGVAVYFAWTSGLLSSLFPQATTTTGTTGGGAPAGGGAGTSATTTTGTTGSGAGTTPVTTCSWPTNPPFALGASGPCQPCNVLAKALALAQAANTGQNLGTTGTLDMDQWNYYVNEVCTGVAAQAGLDPSVIFPNDSTRGGQLNWAAYEGYAQGQGLSGFGAAPMSSRAVMALPRRGWIGTMPMRRAA